MQDSINYKRSGYLTVYVKLKLGIELWLGSRLGLGLPLGTLFICSWVNNLITSPIIKLLN